MTKNFLYTFQLQTENQTDSIDYYMYFLASTVYDEWCGTVVWYTADHPVRHSRIFLSDLNCKFPFEMARSGRARSVLWTPLRKGS